VWNTISFTFISVSLETIFGLIVALVLNARFPGRGLVRAAILIPWAIPTIVSGKMWAWMLNDQFGILNHILLGLGLISQKIAWTANPDTAIIAILIVDVWKTTPFMALHILAGLQLVPGDVYEAAQIDGATKWQTFIKITLPLVKVPLMVAVLFRTLDVLRIYDLPAILTNGGGGTTSLSMLVIKQIRGGFHSASALSTIVFLLIAFTAFLFIKFGGADVVQRPPKSKKKEPAATVGNPVAANATTPGA
jgi:multiple sugar transport system permease protein